jgi:hypothetical protein
MAVVYQHRRNDTNEIFYIGIGKTKKRAYKKESRNNHWKNIVNKTGYSVDILLEGISLEDAKIVEIGMIADYGRHDKGLGPLANQTDGGDGTTNYTPSEKQIESSRRIGKIAAKTWLNTEESRKKSQQTRKNNNIPINQKQKQALHNHRHLAWTKESREKAVKKLKIPVLVKYPDGKVIEYDSATSAGNILSFDNSTISKKIKNGGGYIKGLYFELKNK